MLLELGANLLGIVIGEPPPIGRRAMHIVEIAVGGNSLVDGVAKLGGGRRAVEFDLYRPWRCRGDGEQQTESSALRVPMRNTADRPR